MVGEPHKNRNRWILWPILLNAILRTEGFLSSRSLQFPTAWEISAIVHAGQFGVAFDLTKSFYQVAIAPSVRPFFALRMADGRAFVVTRMPMGCVPSADILHLITALIVLHAEQLYGSVVSSVHFVDNFTSVLLTRDEALHMKSAYEKIFQLFRITVNPEPYNSPSVVIPFCGQILHLSTKQVDLGDKSKFKVQRIYQYFSPWVKGYWESRMSGCPFEGPMIEAFNFSAVLSTLFSASRCYVYLPLGVSS